MLFRADPREALKWPKVCKSSDRCRFGDWAPLDGARFLDFKEGPVVRPSVLSDALFYKPLREQPIEGDNVMRWAAHWHLIEDGTFSPDVLSEYSTYAYKQHFVAEFPCRKVGLTAHSELNPTEKPILVKATDGSTCWDIMYRGPPIVLDQEPKVVSTGIVLRTHSKGLIVRMVNRSSSAVAVNPEHFSKPFEVHEGIIDHDYFGELKMIIKKRAGGGWGRVVLSPGDRACQLMIIDGGCVKVKRLVEPTPRAGDMLKTVPLSRLGGLGSTNTPGYAVNGDTPLSASGVLRKIQRPTYFPISSNVKKCYPAPPREWTPYCKEGPEVPDRDARGNGWNPLCERRHFNPDPEGGYVVTPDWYATRKQIELGTSMPTFEVVGEDELTEVLSLPHRPFKIFDNRMYRYRPGCDLIHRACGKWLREVALAGSGIHHLNYNVKEGTHVLVREQVYTRCQEMPGLDARVECTWPGCVHDAAPHVEPVDSMSEESVDESEVSDDDDEEMPALETDAQVLARTLPPTTEAMAVSTGGGRNGVQESIPGIACFSAPLPVEYDSSDEDEAWSPSPQAKIEYEGADPEGSDPDPLPQVDGAGDEIDEVLTQKLENLRAVYLHDNRSPYLKDGDDRKLWNHVNPRPIPRGCESAPGEGPNMSESTAWTLP